MFLIFKNKKNGFTLVEMMVSITIITVITAVVFLQGTQFNSSILLSNLAYEVALTIREAQVYGLSVRGLNEANPSDNLRFRRGYGVYLDGDMGGAPMTEFIVFSDTFSTDSSMPLGDKRYTNPDPDGDVTVDTFAFRRGYSITKFCLVSVEGAKSCWVSNRASLLTGENELNSNQAVIYFVRPYPEATIHDNTSLNPMGSAEITVASPDGNARFVRVYATGQIEVSNR